MVDVFIGLHEVLEKASHVGDETQSKRCPLMLKYIGEHDIATIEDAIKILMEVCTENMMKVLAEHLQPDVMGDMGQKDRYVGDEA